MKLVTEATINYEKRTITLDGVEFPWAIQRGGPRVEVDGDLSILHLPVLVANRVVAIRSARDAAPGPVLAGMEELG